MEEAARVELCAAGGKIGWQGFLAWDMHNHMQVKQETADIGRGLNVSSRSKPEFRSFQLLARGSVRLAASKSFLGQGRGSKSEWTSWTFDASPWSNVAEPSLGQADGPFDENHCGRCGWCRFCSKFRGMISPFLHFCQPCWSHQCRVLSYPSPQHLCCSWGLRHSPKITRTDLAFYVVHLLWEVSGRSISRHL